MDPQIRMDPITSGCFSRVLPPSFAGSDDPQCEAGGILSVTPEERLAAMEATLNQLFEFTKKSHDRMDRFNDKLEVVARLEERWQSLDQRVVVMNSSIESELSRRNRIDENVFDRVRILENQTGVNTNRTNKIDQYAVPLLSTAFGAALTYLTIQFLGQ